MAVHSKGMQIKVKVASAFVAIPGVANIAVPAGQRAKIDTTDLDSERKEHILDIPESFDLSFTMNLKAGTGIDFQTAQNELEDAYNDGVAREFQVVMPAGLGGAVYSFNATVGLFQPKGQTGAQAQADVTIASTGAVTKAAGA